MLDAGFSGRPEAYAQLAAMHPSGRLGAPADVARCALFLADPANDFLTGTVLGLDGGIAARLHDPVA
jgi:NAD(P)-dependent dehydrogenase (short-subunit alcohol dehydrogenase family)